jgi:hypothetical protein
MPKEKKVLPDLSAYRFRTFYFFPFAPFEFPIQISNPIVGQKSRDAFNKVPSFPDLAILLGLNTMNGTIEAILERLQRQYTAYRIWYTVLSWVGYLFISTPFLLLVIATFVLLHVPGTNANRYVLTPIILLLAYVSLAISQRIVSLLLDHFYADSLSSITCLFLILELAKKEGLADIGNRKRLLIRIRALRRYLILLPFQVGLTSSSSHDAANKKFKLLTQFAQEKENQVMVPSANSQVELFTELRGFLEILLSKDYGDFHYQGSADAETISSQANNGRVLGGLLKLLGTVMPVLFLIAMFVFPKQLGTLGIENNVISYVILAWLLLAIDANLKLGIVDKLSSLAKALRDLR